MFYNILAAKWNCEESHKYRTTGLTFNPNQAEKNYESHKRCIIDLLLLLFIKM